MSQPIYKLFLVKSSAAGYQLSEKERETLFAKVEEAFTKVGGKRILLCNSAWASEQWSNWGVEQFPDMEALQKYTELLNEFNWFQYVESMTILGTEVPSA
jgi:hypothetical protein